MSIADIIKLFSGIALFLFGMSLMGDGLKRVSGNKLEPILFKLSGSPVRGVLLGTGVTAVIQSSSATSVIVVGFVNSGMMKLRQAIPVILGAILGTSITGWVICLSYIEGAGGWSSLLSTSTITGAAAITGILLRTISKKAAHRHIGDILMGFAILMTGMSTMSGSVSGLGQQPWFTSLLTSMSNPILGILSGIVFSAILQSASAAVGIVQALSVTGAMTFSSALPLLMGISIGAAFPVLLSALGANTEGKRTAVSYLVASFMGVMVCASLFYIIESVFRLPFLNNVMSPVSIAVVNTLLRMCMLILLMPFTDILEALVVQMIAEKTAEETGMLRLEDRFLTHPVLAIEQCRMTILDMAAKAGEAVGVAAGLLQKFSMEGMEKVKDLEDTGDKYEDVLGSYLTRLSSQELTEQQSCAVSVFLHSLTDLERISDHAMSIAYSADEIREKQIVFSEEAVHEIDVMTGAINEIVDYTIDSFVTEDLKKAELVAPMEEAVDDLCDEMKLNHVNRLQTGQCTVAHGFVFNDLVTSFERVAAHCSNIAVAIIELYEGDFATHEYNGKMKNSMKRTPEYEEKYRQFLEQFSFGSAAETE